jgi:hypothetical protein
MDAEIKRKWVEALRSGKYAQAQGVVREENSFCCLGVLCDVGGATWTKDKFGYVAAYAGDECCTGSPDALDDAVGLQIAQRHILMRMNDTEHASFSKIADYIEEHL